ncbi:MAG: hypothetical protein GY820_01160 [Gammaproteobacteria bacterium]|nr:hypothetical protein [Gammaproteobacteria bacterium]
MPKGYAFCQPLMRGVSLKLEGEGSMRVFFVTVMIFFSSVSYALESTGWFKINQVFVSNGNNLYFRVYGMSSMSYCPDGSTWAYVDENDSGEKGKISTLLSAYAAGKDVTLHVEPKDHYENGKLYCHIVEVGIKG